MRQSLVRSSPAALGLVIGLAVSGCTIVTGPAPARGPRTSTYYEPAPAAQPAPRTPRASAGGRRPVTHASPRVRRVPVGGRDVPVVTDEGNVFGNGQETPGALRGVVYFIPPGTKQLPELSQYEPVAVLYTNELNVSPRNFTEGFPGVNDRFEWFGIRYEGQFFAENAGVYNFRLLSDDGSKLWIDGKLVADNDGGHAERSRVGQAPLGRGAHSIRVDYYQGSRVSLALQLFVTPPGRSEQLLRSRL